MINFQENWLRIGGNKYHLHELRRWLLIQHPTICKEYFLKAIIRNGKSIFSYDWQGIFTLCSINGVFHSFNLKYKTMHYKVQKSFKATNGEFYGYGTEIPADHIVYFSKEEQENLVQFGTPAYEAEFVKKDIEQGETVVTIAEEVLNEDITEPIVDKAEPKKNTKKTTK